MGFWEKALTVLEINNLSNEAPPVFFFTFFVVLKLSAVPKWQSRNLTILFILRSGTDQRLMLWGSPGITVFEHSQHDEWPDPELGLPTLMFMGWESRCHLCCQSGDLMLLERAFSCLDNWRSGKTMPMYLEAVAMETFGLEKLAQLKKENYFWSKFFKKEKMLFLAEWQIISVIAVRDLQADGKAFRTCWNKGLFNRFIRWCPT